MATLEELNPGSYNDFASRLGLDPNSPEAGELHGQAREALAADRGISVEELHISFGRQTLEVLDAA